MKTKTVKKIKSAQVSLSRTKKTAKNKDISPSAQEYKASIKVFGRLYTSVGSTFKECLENLKVGKAGGICVLAISHGEKKREKIMNGVMLNRLFSQSRIMHEIALKNVTAMFGDL